MSNETLQHVSDWVDNAAPVDISSAYAIWTELVGELTARIEERFDLERDPSVGPWESFTGNGRATGSIKAYTGPEIDWYIDSFIYNPDVSFCNLHVTVWLGPQVRVPHFGLAVACFPEPWAFCDLLPRADMIRNPEYFDRYYAPRNDAWVKLRAENPQLKWFTSLDGFVRATLSPTAFCYSGPDEARTFELVREYAHAQLDLWFSYLDEAEPVPVEEQAELAAADLAMRRNVADRDPANVMAVRYFGADVEPELVKSLWGANRALDRPGPTA